VKSDAFVKNWVNNYQERKRGEVANSGEDRKLNQKGGGKFKKKNLETISSVADSRSSKGGFRKDKNKEKNLV